MRFWIVGIASLMILAAVSASPSEAGERSGNLKVLTFNAWAPPSVFSRLRRPRLDVLCKRLRTAFSSADGWDVVLLQEVWTLADQKRLFACGYPYGFSFDRGNTDSGLMILSRYPLRSPLRWTYSANGSLLKVFQGEVFAEKAVLAARVSVPGFSKDLLIANTHLIADYGARRGENFRERSRQLAELGTWLKSVAPDFGGIILGGDFNTGPYIPSHSSHWAEAKRLLNGLSELPHGPEICTKCPTNSFDAPWMGARKIDHLLVSSDIRAVAERVALNESVEFRKGSFHLSDHFGWEAEFVEESAAPSLASPSSLTCGKGDSLPDKVLDCRSKFDSVGLGQSVERCSLGESPMNCGDIDALQRLQRRKVTQWLLVEWGEVRAWYERVSRTVWISPREGEVTYDRATEICDAASEKFVRPKGSKPLRFVIPSRDEYMRAQSGGYRGLPEFPADERVWLKPEATESGIRGAPRGFAPLHWPIVAKFLARPEGMMSPHAALAQVHCVARVPKGNL